MPLKEKLKRLKSTIRSYESALIAFSGGVDSSMVCAIARETLGDRVIAVTAVSNILPLSELELAKRTAEQIGIRYSTVEIDVLKDPNFIANPPDRCYYCKARFLQKLSELKGKLGFKFILDGTNRDDYSDFRPGSRALKEFGVKSPLAEIGLAKGEVRELAIMYGLPNADKPATPCLATRIPFGQEITPDKLERIAKGEEFIRSLGFGVVRVRDHGDLARVEVGKEQLPRARELKEKIASALQGFGYPSVVIDPRGYRVGGANLF